MRENETPSWGGNLTKLDKGLKWGGWAGIAGIIAIIGLIVALHSPPTSNGQAGSQGNSGITTSSSKTELPTSTRDLSTPTSNPTDTPPVPTATVPQLVGAERLPEDIVLRCASCSDPIVVTITQIVVQPQYNSMQWTLSFYNNSQRTYAPAFNTFSLQAGQDTSQTFTPTGPTVSNSNVDTNVPPGATKTWVITFSFVPYSGTTYTLTADMVGFDTLSEIAWEVQFNPTPFHF